MATIEDLARTLGISVRAIRLRVDALDGTLNAHISRGANNELLFNGEALAILQRLEALRKRRGIPIRQAAIRIQEEIDGNGAKRQRQTTLLTTANLSIDGLARENTLLREMLEEIRHDRDSWKSLAMSLQERLALPSPKPRWWWPFRWA